MIVVAAEWSVGVVGLGRMGLTLASGFGRAVGPGRLSVSGRSAASVERVRARVPSARVLPLAELADEARLLVLCVRNADLPAVLAALRPQLTAEHLVVTVNNGLPLAKLAEAVGCGVAKLIPSVGNELGAGATLLVPGPGLDATTVAQLTAMLRAFSRPYVIEEAQGRAATDLASCGPALLAAAAQSMITARTMNDGQVERGAPLPPALAEQLLAASFGAVQALLEQGATLTEIVDRVAVPGGNTAAALRAGQDGLAEAWRAAFRATADNEAAMPLPALD